jgi:hypothetical protein
MLLVNISTFLKHVTWVMTFNRLCMSILEAYPGVTACGREPVDTCYCETDIYTVLLLRPIVELSGLHMVVIVILLALLDLPYATVCMFPS